MSAMFLSKEVRDLCRITRTTLHSRTKPNSPGFDPDFPHPVKLSPRLNGWLVTELEKYLERKADERTNFPRD